MVWNPNAEGPFGDFNFMLSQESAIDVMANLTNVKDLDSNENLGFVPPTGSKNIQNT